MEDIPVSPNDEPTERAARAAAAGASVPPPPEREQAPGLSAADGPAEATPEMLDPSLVVPVDPSLTGPSCDPALGDGPGADAAVAQARELLSSLGADPAGFEYETTDTGTTRATTVLAHQVVDGQRTGLSWNVTLVADGVQSLYGFLAPLVDLGEYPVVGAATAAARLNDPRFGSGWGGGACSAGSLGGT